MKRSSVLAAAHRVAYAAALAFFVFDFAVLPIGVGGPVLGTLLAVLNLPVAVVGLALPCDQRGLDFPVGHCHWPNQTLFLHHLRLAIPVYVALFYLPNLVSLIRKRRKARGGASAKVLSAPNH